MELLRNQRRFDLTYGDQPFTELSWQITQTEEGDTVTTVYTLEDGLRITNIATKRGDAYEWVNWFENTSDQPSQIIFQLFDTCVTLPMPHEAPLAWTATHPALEDHTVVYAPKGSSWSFDEFAAFPDRSVHNRYEGLLVPGHPRKYATSGGRSSEQNAPFFNVHKDGMGYIFAIGWSGQWNCILARGEDDLTIKTKLEDAEFYLEPHEKLRTSSFVLMPYTGTVIDSQNQWRRLVKEHYSLIGREGRDPHGPLCSMMWGGVTTRKMLDRIELHQKHQLPYEYIWVDAGWYGGSTKPTPDEFEGDWQSYTGDWRVSPLIHPNGLKDVAKAVHDTGMKFLLWFEPERVRIGTPISLEHPEYFLTSPRENVPNLLLDLGNAQAWQYCFDTVAGMIRDIGIDFYRQDFNIVPLPYWRKNDREHRKGITEIKFIMGLYRLWDALLERFPHLMIDNCASGGRRIDIELLRRSVALWRTDFTCPTNYPSEGVQCHNLSFSSWLPYSGTGSGRIYDTYRFRSAYAPALVNGYAFNERIDFCNDPEKLHWLKKMLDEYLKVRPYMTEDFYPLSQVSDRDDVWCASQFHRPDEEDGIVMLFRRAGSPYETAKYTLYRIDPTADYLFTEADGGEMQLSGRELTQQGFCITLPEKRSSKVYFYKKL